MKTIPQKFSLVAFLIVIGISAIALTGILAGILSFSAFDQNFIPMAPGTAISFILTSFAAFNLLVKNKHTILFRVVLIIVLAFNAVVLIDNLLNYPIGIERFFGISPGLFKDFPIGRMSPATCILILISTSSLLFSNNKYMKTSISLSTIGLFTAFTFDLGYLYGTPLLYGQNIIPPALNTSIAFTFLFTGILTGFGMNQIPMILFTGESVRARLMRNFLPSTLLIIILAGLFDSIFTTYFNDHVFISALVTITSLFVLSFIILKISKNIGNDIDYIFEFRKKAEDELRENEMHFRTLADSGQALIWTSGLDKKCNYFNQPWLEFTGKSLEHELGDGWTEGVHPDDLAHCVEIYCTAFDRQEQFSMDYRLRNRDGSYRWIKDNGTPRFNVSGEFVGYIGHCLDITEYKSTESRIKESEEKYRSIFENSSVAILLTAPDGSILSANNFACLLFGMTEAEICRAGRNGIIDLSDPRLPGLLEDRKKTGHSRGELTFTHKDGSKYECEVSSVIFIDNEGKERTSLVIRDLTDQKKAENKIKQLNIELEAKVEKRTSELEVKNADLERMNKLFVGRELRMLELKNTILQLESKLKEFEDTD